MQLQSEQINELMAALSKAQGEIKNAIKDSKNPFFKSNYADLASVKEACQEALTKYGIAVVQATNVLDNGTLVLVTTLGHASGQFIKGIYPLTPTKPNDPQAVGSAVTYARRYTLAAMVGVIADDDDGEAASGRGKPLAQFSIETGDTYNATPDHKKLLVQEVERKGIELSKDQLGALSTRLLSNKVKLGDIGKHI